MNQNQSKKCCIYIDNLPPVDYHGLEMIVNCSLKNARIISSSLKTEIRMPLSESKCKLIKRR